MRTEIEQAVDGLLEQEEPSFDQLDFGNRSPELSPEQKRRILGMLRRTWTIIAHDWTNVQELDNLETTLDIAVEGVLQFYGEYGADSESATLLSELTSNEREKLAKLALQWYFLGESVQEQDFDKLDLGEPVAGEASVNEYGDLVCPHCGTNIITPPGCDVLPGTGQCPKCKEDFTVTQEVADEANRVAG